MKTFKQFCEDAAHDYETGMNAYAKLSAVKRQQERQRSETEADRREKSGQSLVKKHSRQVTATKQKALQKFERQNQTSKTARERYKAEKARQREKTAKIAKDVKKVSKGALHMTKNLVKLVGTRRRRSDSQEN